jgi:hypothetical protein
MTEKEKPLLIQIDDVIREMTPQEISEYEALTANLLPLNPEEPTENE